MTIRVLYLVLSNIGVIIVKNGENIFTGNAYNIPIALMNEWIDCLKIDNDDLVIILK